MSKEAVNTFLATLWYCVWEIQNNIIHNGKVSFEKVLNNFECKVNEYMDSMCFDGKDPPRVLDWRSGRAPPGMV